MTRLAVPKKYRENIEKYAAEEPRNSYCTLCNLTWEFGQELPDLISRLHPEHRPTIMLHEGDFAKGIPTVWLLGWSRHERTGMHGHGVSEAAIAVLAGVVHNKIPGVGDMLVRKGSIITLPKGAIHDVIGESADVGQRDVTVHAYWPPLIHMDYYDDDGHTWKDQWTQGVEDQRKENQE